MRMANDFRYRSFLATSALLGIWVMKKLRSSSFAFSRFAKYVFRMWFFSEFAYWVLFRFKLSAVQKFKRIPQFPESQRHAIREGMMKSFSLISDSANLKDGIVSFIRGWCFNAPLELISQQNVLDLFSKHFFGLYYRQLRSSDPRKIEIQEFTRQVCDSVGELSSSTDSKIDPICPPRDEVAAYYRPLLFYVLVFLCQQTMFTILQVQGFKCFYSGHIRYWHLKGTDTRPPIVFFHGVTPSLLPYLRLILGLKDRELFIVEQPWVSMKIFSHLQIPSSSDIVHDIDFMLAKHGAHKACFIGHSLGSFACAFVVKQKPDLVESLVLLDAPALLMFLPHPTMNFLHGLDFGRVSQPHVSLMGKLVLVANFYFSAREIGITTTMGRNVWWWECNLFAEDLPRNTTVLLSGGDTILDINSLTNYLHRSQRQGKTPFNFRLKVQEGMPHGGFLVSSEQLREVVDLISEFH